jgi:predicted RNA methylase
MSNNLNLTQVTAGQNQKEVTINEQSGDLDAALTEDLDNDYTSGNVTLSAAEWRENRRFNSTNLSVARVLTIPAIAKEGIIDNTDGTDTLTATVGSGTVVVAAGEVVSVKLDGTINHIVRVGESLSGRTKNIWIPAEVLIASTGTPVLATVALTAGQAQIRAMDFDQSANEAAQYAMVMPEDWDLGTITVDFLWSHAAATAFDAIWGAAAVSVADDGAIDVAFGTQVTVTDSGGTTDDQYIATTAAVTVGGTPAAGDMVYFEFERLGANGSDTLDVDARLQGVRINYNTL